MQLKKHSHFVPNALSAAVALALLNLSSNALSQQPELEEVIVTGSFIRRSEGIQSASSLTQLTAAELELEGTINMGQVVNDLSFNQGSSITNTTQGTSDVNTSFNLRGLGTSSTLLLMDGVRTTTENVNLIMPGIAIDRFDIVVDGAAAAYGSSAVAGVVNVIPLRSYDGSKLEYFYEADPDSGFDDQQMSLLTGFDVTDITNVVFAGEFRRSGELHRTERPDLLRAGLTSSGTSSPGNYVVPLRDEFGALTGETSVMPDPNCGEREDPAIRGGTPNGFVYNGVCNYEFGDSRGYRNKQSTTNLLTNITSDISSDLTISAQASFSRLLAESPGSASNPGGRTNQLPVIRGELPGNTFRAVGAAGNPLFAQDSNGDGIPDRDANGQVILDPNGIAFNEDVRLTGWRPLGKHGTQPSRYPSDGSYYPGETDHRVWRGVARADFTMPYVPTWDGTLAYSVGQFRNNSLANNQSFAAIEQGLNCDVINDRDACFNPFVSIDPSTLNSVAVMDSIALFERVDVREQLQTLDLVFNGPVPLGNFSLPGGEVGAAIGYQRREERSENVPTLSQIKDERFIGIQADPIYTGREVDAYFAEIMLPVLSNLEVNLAARHESFSTGQSSTDPKLGVLYHPTHWLTLRATAGTAFIAPTLGQLTAPENCGLTNLQDKFTDFAAFTAQCSQGNPNLVPESSRSSALGFTVAPIDGMSLSLTWNRTLFDDRIINASATDIMNTDFFNFQQATGYVPVDADDRPSSDLVQQWINSPRSDRRIQRNPDNIAEVIRVQTGATNATSMDVEAWDVDFRYRFPMPVYNFGDFSVSLVGTYIESYEYQISPDRPRIEAVGNQNATTGAVPALPQWKVNARLGWTLNNQSVNFNVRHWSSVSFDANKFSFQANLPFSNYREMDTVKAWTQVDASYTYRQLEAFGGAFNFTVGSRNLFDRQAQKSPMNGAVIGELHDPLGRMIYGRVNYEF